MEVDVVYNEDCLTGMIQLADKSIDLVCTDPPYGIAFMGKSWDRAIPSVDIWREALRVLKPGAFAFVMCIPRQDCLARMVVSLEDAGFVVGFSSMYHCFASGFPKAMSISKAVDKRGGVSPIFAEFRDYLEYSIKKSGITLSNINAALGNENSNRISHYLSKTSQQQLPNYATYQILKRTIPLDNTFDDFYREEAEREIIGKAECGDPAAWYAGGQCQKLEYDVTAPATSQAQALDGSYGGFQPKPAVEVILVAMKPLSEKTYVDQALQNGKGVTWLDEGRIPYQNDKDIDNAKIGFKGDILPPDKGWNENKVQRTKFNQRDGRFPANLLVSDDALNDGRISKSEGGKTLRTTYRNSTNLHDLPFQMQGYGDSGSFSRYFSLDAWFAKKLSELPKSVQKTFPFLIVPKASKAEKNRGCEGLYWEKDKSSFGYYQVERERWEWLGREEERIYKEMGKRVSLRARGNIHPTVKPLKLGFYLATIGSREGDIILDPFGGSGWIAIVAKALRRHYIVFETTKENVKISKARITSIAEPLLV